MLTWLSRTHDLVPKHFLRSSHWLMCSELHVGYFAHSFISGFTKGLSTLSPYKSKVCSELIFSLTTTISCLPMHLCSLTPFPPPPYPINMIFHHMRGKEHKKGLMNWKCEGAVKCAPARGLLRLPTLTRSSPAPHPRPLCSFHQPPWPGALINTGMRIWADGRCEITLLSASNGFLKMNPFLLSSMSDEYSMGICSLFTISPPCRAAKDVKRRSFPKAFMQIGWMEDDFRNLTAIVLGKFG